VGIALLLFLVVRTKLQAFVALLLVSLLVGVGAGMPLDRIVESVTTGMGGTLGHIAVLVGLGAMFGGLLDASGGAESLSRALLRWFGERRSAWALGITGFLIASTVFFEVGLILMVSTVYGLTRRTRKPIVFYGIPLLAGLAVTHAFVPPAAGPTAVAGMLGVDLGWVILLGVIAGLPAMAVAGPLFAHLAARWVPVGLPDFLQSAEDPSGRDSASLPSVGLVAGLMGLPLGLIVAGSLCKAILPKGSGVRDIVAFVGHPFVALLLVALLAFRLLGTARGMDRAQVQKIVTKALEPAGVIILVIGAGGVLKQVLVDSGVGKVVAQALNASPLPPLVVAFVLAALLRIMQGSAVVAMLSTGGLVASLVHGQDLSQPRRALLVIAIAAGATTTSHLNDAGFWLVNRYFGLSVPETLRTWTVTTTLIAVVGLLMTLGMGLVL
jgi:Gnt-I system low-affinity gluconate transporter